MPAWVLSRQQCQPLPLREMDMCMEGSLWPHMGQWVTTWSGSDVGAVVGIVDAVLGEEALPVKHGSGSRGWGVQAAVGLRHDLGRLAHWHREVCAHDGFLQRFGVKPTGWLMMVAAAVSMDCAG